MERATAILFAGLVGFIVWLTLCLTNPWAGFVLSLCCFIGLAGFIIFILLCHAFAARGNRRTQTI